jgi:glycosyltransferase involved in cell wall biosynthesis
MSPFCGAAAASALSRRFQIPWVADLRDPWALDELQVHPTALHHRLVSYRMRRHLKDASTIIMNTPEAAAVLLRSFPEFRSKRVISITNGYDAGAFAGLCHHHDPHTFRIVHTGSLHTDFAFQWPRRKLVANILGGATPGVDFFTRSHLVLLRALEKWAPAVNHPERRLRLMLIGNLTAADKHAVESSPARDYVETQGWMRSHAEIMQAQVDADLLFLPMHNLPPGRRATIVPGKTYEYMASKVPVLAAVPEGDARDFLEGAGVARVCRPDDVNGMVQQLERRFREWQSHPGPLPANESYIERFERKHLTQQLAQELKTVCA